ncbi:MAG: dephospho-CoA kinase [Deltaproteobacteria bacterium]|nr:dephospho-CoA kinase [Deltaproteobacteria bacterium]
MKIRKYNKILIGLTGNIASGKSLALEFFDGRLFEKIDSDSIAREHLLNLNIGNYPDFLNLKILNDKKIIDKDRLGKIAFSDRKLMAKLEAAIHPLVIRDIETILRKTTRTFAIVESAIIFESNLDRYFDKIITVFAPYEIRMKRLVKRAKIKPSEAKKRIDFQMDEYRKIVLSDFAIDNSKDKRWLLQQVKNIEKKILNNYCIQT